MSSSSIGRSPTRILLVHSTMDAITHERIEIVNGRAAILNLDVEHISIFKNVNFSGKDSPKPSQWIAANEDDIVDHINDRIVEIAPQFVLLHTGVAFMVAPRTVLSIIRGLKSRHPAVSFGIQRSKTLGLVLQQLPSVETQIQTLFDESPQARWLVETLFP